MIYVGFDQRQKIDAVKEYLEAHQEITNIVYFCPDKLVPLDLSGIGVAVECRTWSDAIMYRYFYPLLENITDKYLIIYDEMLRTKKRNDLTYNCCHHYSNQTPHNIVFSWLPMIDDPEDFMILVDFHHPNIYKGECFEDRFLQADDVDIIPRMVTLRSLPVATTQEQEEAYEEEKEMLFENLGNRDPDTIPRTLHTWCGSHIKKAIVESSERYIARNSRYGKQNVAVYGKEIEQAEEYTVLDFPVRQLQFNEFLRDSHVERLNFLNSGLSVDKVYLQQYENWLERLGGMYVTSRLSAV